MSKNSILTKPQHFFQPNFFLTIFHVKSKLSTAKKSKTFSRVFHPLKNRQFSREIKVEFLDKKWRFRTVCNLENYPIYLRFRCFFFGLSDLPALAYWTFTGFKILPSLQYTLPLMNFKEQWVQWLLPTRAGWQVQGQLGPPKSSSSSSKLIFSSKVALSSSSSSLKSIRKDQL